MSFSLSYTSFIKKLPILFFGYFLCGLGVVMNLYANLGTNPWGIFHVGLSNITSLTLGQISQLVGLALIIFSWLLGISPGFGTIANMIFVGFFIDLIIDSKLIPIQKNFLGQIIQLITSLAILGLGIFLYLRTQLGAGPRDGLMVILTELLDKPIFVARILLDFLVSLLGFLLGGPVGLGSVISIIALGYFIHFFFKLNNFDSKSKQFGLLELVQSLRNKNH